MGQHARNGRSLPPALLVTLGAALLAGLLGALLFDSTSQRVEPAERSAAMPVDTTEAAERDAPHREPRAEPRQLSHGGFDERAPRRRAEVPEHGVASAQQGSILGNVVGPDGAPLEDAEVALFDRALHGPRATTPLVQAPPPVARTRTDADGRYRFPARHGELHAVAVLAEGFLPRSRNQRADVDVPLELERSTRLRGHVSSGGRDRPGIAITLRDEPRWDGETFREPGTVVSDASGRFALARAARGSEIEVHIAPPGAVGFEARYPTADADETVLEITLDHAARWTGSVVRRIGDSPAAPATRTRFEPVPGASVRLGDGWSTTTDGLGRFTVALEGPLARWGSEPSLSAPENVALPRGTAHAAGFCTSHFDLPRLLRRAEPGELAPIVLAPAGVVTGLVLDGHEQPIADAEIQWYGMQHPAGAVSPGPGSQRTSTDVSGRFRLPELPIGSKFSTLQVRAPSGVERRVDEVSPVDPETPLELVIRVAEGSVLTVRLIADGWPTAGVLRIQPARSEDDPSTIEEHAVRSSGLIELIGLAPGTYLLSSAADANDEFTEPTRVEVAENDSATVALATPARNARVRGQVLGPSGEPVRLSLRLAPADPSGFARLDAAITRMSNPDGGPFDLEVPLTGMGRYVLYLDDSRTTIEAPSLFLTRGQRHDGFQMQIPELYERTVRCVGAAGTPLPPVMARLRWTAATRALQGQIEGGAWIPIPPEGRTITLPTGALVLRAEVEGYLPGFVSVDGSAAENALVVELAPL